VDINILIIKKIILDEIKNPENHTYHYINNIDDIEIIHYQKLSTKIVEGEGFYIDFRIIKTNSTKSCYITNITYEKYLTLFIDAREEKLNRLLNEI